MEVFYKDELVKLILGDCKEVLLEMVENIFDLIFTDPPYELGFMGKSWDKAGISFDSETWKLCLRVLKPGGYLLSFGGTRTFHRIACAIEDAGFEFRDTVMWLYGCLSDDTEILTQDGWKGRNQITQDDKVFSFNLRNKSLNLSKVKTIFEYKYNGEMISLKNHNTDQLLTPNHKVICEEAKRKQIKGKREYYGDEEFKYLDAMMIDSAQYKLPLAGYYEGPYSIGGDFAELIGWVLAEGHFQKDCNAVNIYQSSVNLEYVKRIRYILGRLGVKYSEYKRRRKYKGRKYIEFQFYIGGKWATLIKSIIPNKKPTNNLWHLTLREKERLIIGLCGGDGSKLENGKYGYFWQKDLLFLEWFQVLLHLTGKQGWINKKKYSCSIHYNDQTQIQGKHHKNRVITYKGYVWCIETEKGNFIARRKGKIFITGNSGFPKSLNVSKAIDKNEGNRIYQTGNENKVILEKTIPSTFEAKQWQGWGTALKPAFEPILVFRKPFDSTVAENVLEWGTGALNIDASKVINPSLDELKQEYLCLIKTLKKEE